MVGLCWSTRCIIWCVIDMQGEEHRRHLLRLLLSPVDARPLPDVYGEIMAGTTPGFRGGIDISRMPDVSPCISLEAE